MLIVRYCNKFDEITDQIVEPEYSLDVYNRFRNKYGKAELITLIDDIEFCLL